MSIISLPRSFSPPEAPEGFFVQQATMECQIALSPPRVDTLALPVEAELLQDLNLRLASLQHESMVRANRLIEKVGSVALSQEVSKEPTMHLLEATKRAYSGNDPEALGLVRQNVRTDVIERAFKAGHIMKVHQRRNVRGQIVQHGQTAEQIQENTLRYANGNPRMKARTKAETTNMYYLEALAREGLLEDNYAVVVSLCPTLDDQTLDKLGFFSFSKSLVIQATTAEGLNVTTESAFIAGVEKEGGPRKDHATAAAFGRQHGKDWQGLDDAQIIQQVLLVPKSQMPNGVVDLVKQWDDLNGGTFFGQAKPRQDYLQYLQQCRERERNFEPTVQRIAAALITQAPYLRTPTEATKALNKLSGAHVLEQALKDTSIDARVFGGKAAIDLEEARFHHAQGNTHQAHLAMSNAHKNNASGSCPSTVAGVMGDISPFHEDGRLKTPDELAKERLEAVKDSDEMGSLKFSCQNGHANRRRRGELIPNCTTCGVEVACKPEVKSKKEHIVNAAKNLGKIAVVFWQKFSGSSESVSSKSTHVESVPAKVVTPAPAQAQAVMQANLTLAA